MALRPATFTTENIVAILEAAPRGGTVQEVIDRAGADVSEASVKNWIKRGQQARNADETTSHRLFLEQWEALYPGSPPRHEMSRMIQIQQALQQLGIKQEDEPPPVTATPRTPRKSSRVCDCGNAKTKEATACATCIGIDSGGRAA